MTKTIHDDQSHIRKIGTELQRARVGSATESLLMKEYRDVNLGYLFLLDFITEGGGRQGKASRDIRLGSSPPLCFTPIGID